MAALPALPALPAAAQNPAAAGVAQEMPKLRETAPDATAQGVRRFFSTNQEATLRRLAELVVPRSGDRPGAVEAGAVEFLDFLVGASGERRRNLYRTGLDRLHDEARLRYGKPFTQLSAEQARPLLEPLMRPWTYEPPADAFARFLREVRDDLLQATTNSREHAEALSGRSRSAAGLNTYWLPLD